MVHEKKWQKCLWIQVNFRRSEETVSGIMWLIKGGDAKFPTHSPTHQLTRYLHKTILCVQNPQHLVHINQIIPKNTFVSYDVEWPFIRVPIHDISEVLLEHLTAAPLPQNLSILIGHCISTNFFVHQRKIDHRIDSTAMGCPLSLLLRFRSAISPHKRLVTTLRFLLAEFF